MALWHEGIAGMTSRQCVWFLTVAVLCEAPCAEAHPLPRRSHDRTIVVVPREDCVRVLYHLEVDEFTAIYQDLPDFADRIDFDTLTKPDEFFTAFTRCLAPVLAENLCLSLDGMPIPLECIEHRHARIDHLACDFVFEGPWTLDRDRELHTLRIRESNYPEEMGRVRIRIDNGMGVAVSDRDEADPQLQESAPTELGPGDDNRLRSASASLTLHDTAVPELTSSALHRSATRSTLLDLFLHGQAGFVTLLFLAAGFGAAHALTPGHGKTLVAAYLVGENGTVAHAFVLGLVTTLSHTGAVILLSILLLLWYPTATPGHVQSLIGFLGGLLIAGLGAWLFLKRLAGQADHVHWPGQGHSHHGHHAQLEPGAGRGGWGGLVLLGISGGMIPCWDAMAMFGLAISMQRTAWALPLLLAFSLGLAAVLIFLGIAVVKARRLATRRWGQRHQAWIKALPIVSALIVMAMGLWLCHESIR